MTAEPTFPQILHQWAEVFMRRSFRDFKRFMDESGLSASQVSTLMKLYHCQACAVSEIGEHLGVTNPAASQLIERLVQQGLLQRSEDPQDRRARQISLTAQGRTLIENGIEARRRWMEELTGALSLEEQQTITGALILLTQAARALETEQESI
jgi:DNA-binding MarR family transcriptional regulator